MGVLISCTLLALCMMEVYMLPVSDQLHLSRRGGSSSTQFFLDKPNQKLKTQMKIRTKLNQ